MKVQYPLPVTLRDSARLDWILSYWCNYSCDYCGVPVFRKRDAGAVQAHAFDYHGVDDWLEAFDRFPQRHILIKLSGGEPFLDHENIISLLKGLVDRKRFEVRIFTNGYWNPERFRSVVASAIHLIVSFHPRETSLERHIANLVRIRDCGFKVAFVNYVIAPENLAFCEASIEQIEKAGFAVNAAPMQTAGIYVDRQRRDPAELALIRKLSLPIDAWFRVVNPVTFGRPCFHPSLSYSLDHQGNLSVSCTGPTVNLFCDSLPSLPCEAVPCPSNHCGGCMEMYRSLADEPLAGDLRLGDATDHVEEIRWQRRGGEDLGTRSVMAWRLRVWEEWEKVAERRPDGPADFRILEQHQTVALPDQPVFGYIDSPSTGTIQFRPGDRVWISGWAATTNPISPVQKVRIFLDGVLVREISDFYPRPEVAALFGKRELLDTGWRTAFYVPELCLGNHRLTASAHSADDAAYDLPPGITLRIV